VFSMADLNGNNGHLYGKYKKGRDIIEVECLEENVEEGTTYCKIKQPVGYEFIKTSKIYDLFHSNEYLW